MSSSRCSTHPPRSTRGGPLPTAPLLPGAGRTARRVRLVLVSPIILYDHPEIAEQSEGALYDSTEIDEILTLRVMTMTDEEKAAARATDPLAAQIIDRCDSMSPEAMLNLHGVLRNPHTPTADAGLIPRDPRGRRLVGSRWPTTRYAPTSTPVLVNGVRVRRGSRVRLRPSRRADAQDLFFAGQDRSGHLGARGRRRRPARRRRPRGRSGRRPARLVRPLPVLRTR